MRIPLFASAALIFFLFCIINPYSTDALSPDGEKNLFGYIPLPSEYGEIIYCLNEESPRQVYIVANSHRNFADSLNSDNTVQTQTEIFRIGEWLNRSRGIELMLPEGFFTSKGEEVGFVRQAGLGLSVNNVLLREKLADQTRYVNAEILLMEYLKMHVSQVEDEDIYNAVCMVMHEMRTNGSGRISLLEMKHELLYLQQLRTAKLLQRIPLVIEKEQGQGTIQHSTAMFTIGLSHITDIIRYVDENRIWVAAPSYPANRFKSHQAKLNLIKKDFGVTIIIPRSLADNRKLLQLTNLEHVLLAKGNISTQY